MYTIFFVSFQKFSENIIKECNQQWQALIGKTVDNGDIAW
jgi:hypothetical protein